MPSAGGIAVVGPLEVAAPDRHVFDAALKTLFASPLLELPARTEPLFPDYVAARAALTRTAASDDADDDVGALAAGVSAAGIDEDGPASSPDAMEEDCEMEDAPTDLLTGRFTYPTTSDDPEEAALIGALEYFRNVLVVPDELDPPIEDVVEAGIVGAAATLLRTSTCPRIVYECMWILTNIASGEDEHTQLVADTNILETALQFIQAPTVLDDNRGSLRLREVKAPIDKSRGTAPVLIMAPRRLCDHAVFMMGNLCNEPEVLVKAVELGLVDKLVALLQSWIAGEGYFSGSMLLDAIWCSQVCLFHPEGLVPVQALLEPLVQCLGAAHPSIRSEAVAAVRSIVARFPSRDLLTRLAHMPVTFYTVDTTGEQEPDKDTHQDAFVRCQDWVCTTIIEPAIIGFSKTAFTLDTEEAALKARIDLLRFWLAAANNIVDADDGDGGDLLPVLLSASGFLNILIRDLATSPFLTVRASAHHLLTQFAACPELAGALLEFGAVACLRAALDDHANVIKPARIWGKALARGLDGDEHAGVRAELLALGIAAP